MEAPSPISPTAPGGAHPFTVPALRGGGIEAPWWLCVDGFLADMARFRLSWIAPREAFDTLLDGLRGGIGLAFASVGERHGSKAALGRFVARCDGFLATGGGPFCVFCEAEDAFDTERGGGGEGTGFLATLPTEGTGV